MSFNPASISIGQAEQIVKNHKTPFKSIKEQIDNEQIGKLMSPILQSVLFPWLKRMTS